jgi:hypothetical protein
MASYKGVLVFHSETGTEGGYWAFMDEKFMNIPSEAMTCIDCGLYWTPGMSKKVRCPDDKFYRKVDELCTQRGSHNFELTYPDGSWSYDGLHTLKSGDHITVYEKDDPTKVLWDGTIDLTEFTVFENSISGLWIHNYQKNVDQDFWMNMFLYEHPVEVETVDTAVAM